MSEDESRRITQQDEEGAEVDAHAARRVNEDPVDELRRENDDDDFEAHKKPTGMV
jgi:hypothetical protein